MEHCQLWWDQRTWAAVRRFRTRRHWLDMVFPLSPDVPVRSLKIAPAAQVGKLQALSLRGCKWRIGRSYELPDFRGWEALRHLDISGFECVGHYRMEVRASADANGCHNLFGRRQHRASAASGLWKTLSAAVSELCMQTEFEVVVLMLLSRDPLRCGIDDLQPWCTLLRHMSI